VKDRIARDSTGERGEIKSDRASGERGKER
jgi:hypothetical protein